MSRLALSAPAEREARPARILISGLPGSGLTLTALTLAAGLAAGDEFLMIDTERRSALTYAGLYPFEHLPWAAPYRPVELAGDVFEGARRWPVVVVDTITRFWSDTAGVRDIADGVGRGSEPSGWDHARPAHRRLMAAIAEARAHVIVTCRTRVETVPGVDLRGLPTVEQLPGALVQDDTVLHELDVHLRLDLETHTAAVGHSRIPVIRQGGLHQTTELDDLAATYRAWCDDGARMADIDDVQLLVERLDLIHPGTDKKSRDARIAVKQRFADVLGLPQHLRATQLDQAQALVLALEEEAHGPAKVAERAHGLADRVHADKSGATAGKDAAAEGATA